MPTPSRTSTWAPQIATRRAQEHALFARLAREPGPAARDTIVEHFMPLARSLAQRYRNVEDIDDLEQVAALGLVNAVERFDADRGLAFSSFAFPTILGELKRHLRDRNWSVRVPRDVQELSVRLDRVSAALSSELGRAPTVSELAERADSTVERVLEALQTATARTAVSLDQPRYDDAEHGDRMFEVAVTDPGFETAEQAAELERRMRVLPRRERVVLELRFRGDFTQTQIGEIVGISQMQVSRVLRSAIETLQAAVG